MRRRSWRENDIGQLGNLPSEAGSTSAMVDAIPSTLLVVLDRETPQLSDRDRRVCRSRTFSLERSGGQSQVRLVSPERTAVEVT
jgi:hypothetical protein